MKCEFCNALCKHDWDGCDLNWFHCGTMYPYGKPCRLDQTAQCQEAEREKLKASIERLKVAGDAILEFYKSRKHNEFFSFVAGVQKIESDWTSAKEEQP